MKRFHALLATALLLMLGNAAQAAQSVRDDFKQNVLQSASNYFAYPYLDAPAPALTAAPEGYKPFYIDHYGRHGSRWLIDPKQYQQPVDALEKADRCGKLTDLGRQTLTDLRGILNGSKGRLGELTDVGAEQHRIIAKRMYRNFPEVFAGDARVTARSSVVIRCILSMSAELQELYALNPRLRISEDASEADMYYCAHGDSLVARLFKENNAEVERFMDSCVQPTGLCQRLFTDQQFAADSIDAKLLMINLFDICSNQQSHHTPVSFYHLFTPDETYSLWQRVNAFWYAYSGFSRYTHFRAPYSQWNLLRDMLLTADAAIADGSNQANLRFGHESCLLPLACLMNLNGAGVRDVPLDRLPDAWQNYKIYPMGCNIQWIFYRRPGSDDTLVKVLLNEAEATLPIKTDMAPYYHWRDVRDYYWHIVNDYEANRFDSDLFTTKHGKQVRVSFIKHGTLMIQVDGDYTIHIDPVADAVKHTDYSMLPKADMVLVTHEHYDHFDAATIRQISKPDTKILANAAAIRHLGTGTALRNGDYKIFTADSSRISISAIPAYNVTRAHRKFHPKGKGNGYLLDIDGLRILIAGDTEDIPEYSAPDIDLNADVAFLPVNQPYTMTPDQCVKLAKMLNPKVLYPYHYGNTPVQTIVDALRGTSIDVRIRSME